MEYKQAKQMGRDYMKSLTNYADVVIFLVYINYFYHRLHDKRYLIPKIGLVTRSGIFTGDEALTLNTVAWFALMNVVILTGIIIKVLTFLKSFESFE